MNEQKKMSSPEKRKQPKAFNGDSKRVAGGGELHQIASGKHPPLTTNQGVVLSDNQNSLRANPIGPTLLEDFILREKISQDPPMESGKVGANVGITGPVEIKYFLLAHGLEQIRDSETAKRRRTPQRWSCSSELPESRGGSIRASGEGGIKSCNRQLRTKKGSDLLKEPLLQEFACYDQGIP